MGRQKETLTLSVPSGTKEKLEEIAKQHGIKWGDNPSASGLITAITRGELRVISQSETLAEFFLTPTQIQSIKDGAKALIDQGKIKDAQVLLSLLENL